VDLRRQRFSQRRENDLGGALKRATILILSFFIVCSASYVGCHKETNIATTGSIKETSQTVSTLDNGNIVKDQKEKRSELERVVKKMASDYDLRNLKDEPAVNEFEWRLWSVPGLEYPTCLILTRNQNKWDSTLLTSQNPNVTHSNKKGALTNRLQLMPKFEWAMVSDILERNGAVFPLSFALDDEEAAPIPDEGELFLEIRNGGNYDAVGYREFSESSGKIKLINLCSELKREFNVAIECFQH